MVWTGYDDVVPDALLRATLESPVADSAVCGPSRMSHGPVHLPHGGIRPHVQHCNQAPGHTSSGFLPLLPPLVPWNLGKLVEKQLVENSRAEKSSQVHK